MDTGADGYIFISPKLAKKMVKHLQSEQLDNFRKRGVSDYRGKSTQEISQLVRGHLRIQGRTIHNEWMIVLEMKHDLLIGKNWFAYHNIWLDCAERRLLFPTDWEIDPSHWKDISVGRTKLLKSQDYQEDMIRRQAAMDAEDKRRRDRRSVRERIEELERLKAIPVEPPKPKPKAPQRVYFITEKKPTRSLASNPIRRQLDRMEREVFTPDPDVEETERKQPSPRLPKITIASLYPESDIRGPYKMKRDAIGWYKERTPDLATVGAVSFLRTARKSRDSIHVMSLYELDCYIQDRREQLLPRDEEDLAEKITTTVPKVYHDFLDVFSKAESDVRAPHRPGKADHRIELLEGKT
ncbi:hypothetical protein B0T26DRAFT_816943, partial [Lasiosphaeria miniovina]